MEKFFREVKTRLQFENKENLDFLPHIHNEVELIYVKKGKCTAFCSGKHFELLESCFFLVFPNQIHHYTDCEKGEYITLILSPLNLSAYKQIFETGIPISPLLRIEDEDNIKNLLLTALKEFLRDGPSPIIDAYLTIVFGKLLKYYDIDYNKTSIDTASQIIIFCKKHYKENISLNDVSSSLHISRSCISHILSEKLSVNFCNFINSLRLNDAIILLRNEKYSITEISELAGFPTIRTFNRAFLKKYGISPKIYRKTVIRGEL